MAGLDDDTTLVAVELLAEDLSPTGLVQQRFAGTWRVLHQSGICTLLGASIQLVEGDS